MRRRVELRVDGSIFVMRGWQAHKLAYAAGLRPTYSGVQAGWVADTVKLPQFCAYLDHRNVAYTIEDEGSPAALRDPEETSSESDMPVELDLFGGVA